MPKMSKNQNKKSKLVCICGFVGDGKTTSTNFFNDLGFETFNTDKWIHKIYLKHEIGYKLILKLFGNRYVNEKEVDRVKLKKLIINNLVAKKKLERNINWLIYKKINQLKQKNKFIFVELGIYLYNWTFFRDLFDKVIVIDGTKRNTKNDDFKKFSKIKKFSTNPVGNLKNIENNGIFYCDFIVENNLDIENLRKELLKILSFL